MIQALFPSLAKIYFQKLITAAALAGLFFDSKYIYNIKKNLSMPQGRLILFLFFWMIMSVPFSIYPGWSFRFLTENFWKVIALVLMVFAYVSSEDKLDKIIWVYILSVGILSVITITSSSGNSRFAVGGGYDPNDTALQFILVLPFVFWKFRTSQGLMKIMTAFISVMLLIGIIKTNSRGGFMGLMAVSTILLLQLRHVEKRGIWKGILLLTAIVWLLVYYGGAEYQERMSTIFNPSEGYNVTGETGRIAIWKRGIDMMFNNPLLGVGVACFNSADGMLYSDIGARWNAAHNSFVQIGAELGFPGLIVFCLLIWGSIKNVSKLLSVNKDLSKDSFRVSTSYSIVGSWVGFIVAGFFLSAAYISSFYFLLAVSMSFLTLEKADKQQTELLSAVSR